MAGITHLEMILRIAVGAALGAAIGLERDRHGRQAGLRTHLIVGLASATFMVVSTHFWFFQNYAGTPGVSADPSRIAASVVTGIGFLAGGTILRTGLTVQGLTTAAGLWLVAAIGLCAGGGMFSLAVAATALGLLAMTVLRQVENKDDRMVRREVAILLEENPLALHGLFAALGEEGAVVSDFDFEKTPGAGQVKVHFQVRVPVALGPYGLIALLERQPGVSGIQVHAPF
jgi:putative Mg2+ transporter-C (MgtC) family protein